MRLSMADVQLIPRITWQKDQLVNAEINSLIVQAHLKLLILKQQKKSKIKALQLILMELRCFLL